MVKSDFVTQYYQGFALNDGSVKVRHLNIDNDLNINNYKIKNIGNPEDVKDGVRKADLAEAGKWQVVYENTLTEDVNNITINNLDINRDKEYYLTVISAEESDFLTFLLYVNNDTENEHYITKGFFAGSDAVYMINDELPLLTYTGETPFTTYIKTTIIKDTFGNVRYMTHSQTGVLDTYYLSTFRFGYAPNVTSLMITNTSNLIRGGTYILLCKPRG
jgi:hypothetical protein